MTETTTPDAAPSARDKWERFLDRMRPERLAGGYGRTDDAIQFYLRIHALLNPDMTVLDYGAGRGNVYTDECRFKRELTLLRGKVREVVGVDIDPEVILNRRLDRALVVGPLEPLPLDGGSIDLIVSNWVLEHIERPEFFAAQVERVLKPGGWFCAKTNHRWGLTSVASSLIPSNLHTGLLDRVQPGRREEDIHATYRRMNTMAAVVRHFPPEKWLNCSYYWKHEPSYHAKSPLLWRIMDAAFGVLPGFFVGTFNIFLQKKPGVPR